ncbi:MAG: GtrA family protein [Oscillospiraceae bacterium]|nr:GtrA family protein [Oscillospiraceae bacterium]
MSKLKESRPMPEKELKLYALCKPLIIKPLRPLLFRHQEFFCYALTGVATVLANVIVFFLLNGVMNYLAANAIAWIASVVVAFIGNKVLVFEDMRWSPEILLFEAGTFTAARAISLLMEEAILAVFIEAMGLDSRVVKLIAQVIVILVNYIASKLIVFKYKSGDKKSKG